MFLVCKNQELPFTRVNMSLKLKFNSLEMHTSFFFAFMCKSKCLLIIQDTAVKDCRKSFFSLGNKQIIQGHISDLRLLKQRKINFRESVWCSGSYSFLNARVLRLSNFVHLSLVLYTPSISSSCIFDKSCTCSASLPFCNMYLILLEKQGDC